MNNTFNIQRFSRLLNKQIKDNYASYLMSLAVLAGILAITMGIGFLLNHGNFDGSSQAGFYATFVIIAGAIFTSMVFADLGDKKKAIPALTLPVSHFEKFLVGWLISVIIYLIVFTVTFCAVDLLMINLANSFFDTHTQFFTTADYKGHFGMLLIGFGFLHAVTFFGAIFFEKLHFIKSIFALFIVLFLIWLADQPLAQVVFGQENLRAIPYVGVAVPLVNNYTMITANNATLLYYTLTALILILWTAAFFKLKEKQV
jgi:hypothetical protein